jgi:hypothetical protein
MMATRCLVDAGLIARGLGFVVIARTLDGGFAAR